MRARYWLIVPGLVLPCLALLCGCYGTATRPATEPGVVERDRYVDGVRLHTVQSGSGPDVLLLHGLGGATYTWRPVRPLLPGYRLTAVDLMGFGESAKPESECYTYRRQATLIGELIRRLHLRNYIIAGHSYGGGVALQTYGMLRETKRARLPIGLILVDTVAYRQELPSRFKIMRQRRLMQLIFDFMPRQQLTRDALKDIFLDDGKITPEMVNAYAYYSSLPGGDNALIETARNLVPPEADLLPLIYPCIDVPALVLWGDQDGITPVETGERLAKALPEGRLKVIAQCGHDPMEEQPQATAAAMREWLEETTTARAGSPRSQ